MAYFSRILSTLGAYAVLASPVMAQEAVVSQPPIWAAKPDIVAFEKMENDRLSRAQQAIDALIAVKGARTIDNTLALFDEAILQLDNAANFARLVEAAHPNATYRDHGSAMNGKVNAAVTALALNRDVYEALARLDLSNADPATRFYVQRRLLTSRLAGVDKDDATRARLQRLKDELTQAQSEFDRNINDDQKTVLADLSELEGLPQDYIERHKPGPDGKVRITTDYPDFSPVMSFAKSDALRRRVWETFNNRAYPKNRDVLLRMMKLRFEIASLLGYSSWADYNAASNMALSGRRIAEFIEEVDAAARPATEREYAILLAEKRKIDPSATQLRDYEVSYLTEQVIRSRYGFDSQLLRPYLPYARVIQGVLDTAARLFHVSFRQELNVPVWEPSVETWDVLDGGNIIGRIYLDTHPRPGKDAGLIVPLLAGVRGRQLPEVALLSSFPQPSATDPALMEFDDVAAVLFHQFGGAMHRILSGRQRWAGTNNRNMEFDFIQTPTQLFEKWPANPAILTSFAHHYKTGKPIPAELVARMNRAAAFGRGMSTAYENALSAISLDVHKANPQEIDLDILYRDDIRRYTPMEILSGTRPYASFPHLGDFSSDYYIYLWDQVIVEDFFEQFNTKDLFSGGTPSRYRRAVLEPGGSMSANDLVKNFLGRPQNVTAFQHWLAKEFETSDEGIGAGIRKH